MSLFERFKNVLPGPIKRALRFMRVVFKDYGEDNGGLVAASVSFYVFLSLIPLLLLGVAIVGWFLKSPERAESMILSAITSNAPELASQTQMLQMLRDVVEQLISGRGVATGVGLLALIWTGTSVVANLEKAINLMWGVERRKFIQQRLLALGLLLLMGVLLGVSFGITALFNAVKSLDIAVPFVNKADLNWAWQLLGYLVPIALLVLTYTVFYKIVPNTSVRWSTAFFAGLFAGILLYVAQLLFGYYVTHFSNYSAVYGSLAGLFILLIWINYSAIITMLGAEVGAVHAGRRNPE